MTYQGVKWYAPEVPPQIKFPPLRLAAYGVEADMPTPTTILAFDPGGTTGWCMATFDPETAMIYNLKFGQIPGPRHHPQIARTINNALGLNAHLMVVSEDYRPEFGRPQNYIALEYIGVMEYVCRSQMISFERQDRSVKTFWTSSRLQRVGFWPKGQPHAQDAARHWLAYACKQNRDVEIELADRIR